ncbi:MAG TPA: hypothetical protein VGK64_26505 [Bryobacteraceae bacterium]
MDLRRMIGELRAEKTRLDEAILALERLAAGKLRRRGRPPHSPAEELKHKTAAAGADDSDDNAK